MKKLCVTVETNITVMKLVDVPFHMVEEGQQVGSFIAVKRKKLVSKQSYEYIYIPYTV